MLKALLDQPSLGISELMCSCVPWFYWMFQPLITKHPQQRQAHCWGIRPASLWVCVCGDEKRPVAASFSSVGQTFDVFVWACPLMPTFLRNTVVDLTKNPPQVSVLIMGEVLPLHKILLSSTIKCQQLCVSVLFQL